MILLITLSKSLSISIDYSYVKVILSYELVPIVHIATLSGRSMSLCVCVCECKVECVYLCVAPGLGHRSTGHVGRGRGTRDSGHGQLDHRCAKLS